MYFWLALLVSSVGLYSASGYSTDYHDPHCDGKQVIVHLFEWKWSDVAAECERYLGPKGFCGVQVSPPNENAVVGGRPWWERYQPVSYKLTTRSGNKHEFKDMVDRCKAVGVRIYADAVINHMAGSDRRGTGTAGSSFDGGRGDFPGVPFSNGNFHTWQMCGAQGGINYQDPRQVRNCDLVGLRDLDHGQGYVQDKVAEYLNALIALGVAGFRIDAAKHMWPADIGYIQNKVHDLPEGGRPFFFLEVIDPNTEPVKDHEYFNYGFVTEFRYHGRVKSGAYDLSRLRSVSDAGYSMVPSDKALVFVDNHDTQRKYDTLTYKNGAAYKRAVAFTLANDYGLARVMSSFSFSSDGEGPPHEGDYSIKDVTINRDGGCGNGWVCEHRWNMVGNMARFRTYVHRERISNWHYSGSVLSFSRGSKGFFAMGLSDFNERRETGLPPGEYCDLISDCATTITVDDHGYAQIKPADSSEPFVAITTAELAEKKPEEMDDEATSTTVGEDENEVQQTSTPATDKETSTPEDEKKTPASKEDKKTSKPKDDKITSKPKKDKKTSKPKKGKKATKGTGGQEDFQRTVIMIEKNTRYGQDVFIRGGIDSSIRSGCTGDAATSPCSIPIRHVQQYYSSHFNPIQSWSQGDNYLDWYGAEPGQAYFNGKKASGTAAYWSSNDRGNAGYSELNRWGDHYWVVDVEMDCSKTEDGYFQLRGSVDSLLERRFSSSVGPCVGSGAPSEVPFQSNFHIARCGHLNVFHWGREYCSIETL